MVIALLGIVLIGIMFISLVLRKIKFKHFFISLLVGIGMFLFGAILDSKNSEIKQSDNFETKIEQSFGKDSKIIRDDSNIIIDINNYEDSSSRNSFVNSDFPEDAATILSYLKDQDFEKIMIRSIGTLSDDKGNQDNGVYAAVMYSKDSLSEIDFNNWISQVSDDSTPFYTLSEAYYILPDIFKDSDKNIISDYAKGSSKEPWVKYIL